MAKTAAEKQKAYRERQKVTRDGNGNAPNVTKSEADALPSLESLVVDPDKTTVQTSPDGKRVEIHETSVKCDTFADLPADVQASIERHCSENNKGERAASHSRAAMTERALAYQDKMGKRPGKGVTAVERHVAEPERHVAGPIDVYSPERWARLQAKGWKWGSDGNAVSPYGKVLNPVPVPGDPAYGETGGNTCTQCGQPTGHKLVVKCLKCCTAQEPAPCP